MAKTLQKEQTGHAGAASSASDEAKKERKKQAKREAKMMLKLEQVRKDVQKAEQKVTKAQSGLEASQKRLHKLETRVQELSSPASSTSATQSVQPTEGDQQQQVNTSSASNNHASPSAASTGGRATMRNDVASLPPVEGRTDIDPQQAHDPTKDQASVSSEKTTGNGGTSKSRGHRKAHGSAHTAATTEAEAEQPARLSPEAAHDEGALKQTPTEGSEKTDTAPSETNKQETETRTETQRQQEEPALLSPQVARTGDGAAAEQSDAQATPVMEENAQATGEEEHHTTHRRRPGHSSHAETHNDSGDEQDSSNQQ